MKLNELFNTAAFLAILFFFSTSCTKEDPVLPDYVGTWRAMDTILIGDKITPRMDLITLTETTFFDAIRIELPQGVVLENPMYEDGWADYIGVKGSISVNGNVITQIITEIGIYSFDPHTGLPTGEWIIYKKDHAEFGSLLSDWNLTQTIESQFTILGNELTLKTDLNGDGDFEDENKIIVYRKET